MFKNIEVNMEIRNALYLYNGNIPYTIIYNIQRVMTQNMPTDNNMLASNFLAPIQNVQQKNTQFFFTTWFSLIFLRPLDLNVTVAIVKLVHVNIMVNWIVFVSISMVRVFCPQFFRVWYFLKTGLGFSSGLYVMSYDFPPK